MTKLDDRTQSMERPRAEFTRPAGPLRVDVAGASHTGLVRKNNEDAFVIFRIGRYIERVDSNIPESDLPSRSDPSGVVMIVADGIGGHEGGDVASRSTLLTTIDLLLRSPRWALRLDDPETRDAEIRALMARSKMYLKGMHEALRRQAASDMRLAGMGTTYTGAYVIGADLFVMHVGDSKAYLVHDGAIEKVTRDHTLAQEYADAGAIPQEDVARHRLQHVLTRAVGQPEQELQGDMHHLQIAAGHRLLLCSDGLTDMVPDDEILEVLNAHPGSDDACRALIDEALDSGGRDNITVIVAGFSAG